MGCNTSNEPHACCPPGSWPALQVEYELKGKTIDLGEGLKVYEAGTGTKALVLFEDIFGTESGRHRTLADTFASFGYIVYLPELLDPVYQGSIEDMPKLLEALQKQKIATIKSRYERLSQHIKAEGADQVLAVAFCWGVWAAFRVSADFGNIKAIAGIHPSLNVENFYGGKEIDLVQSVKCPAFLYSCSNDQPGTKKGGEYVKILADKFGDDKTGSEEFPEQQHGFVTRGDLKSEAVKRDIEKVIKMAQEYLSKFK